MNDATFDHSEVADDVIVLSAWIFKQATGVCESRGGAFYDPHLICVCRGSMKYFQVGEGKLWIKASWTSFC